MNKPTPGPWICTHLLELTTADDSKLIATIYNNRFASYRPTPKEAEANGALIAAAPDLLEVCRQVAALLQPELTKEPERTIFWSAVAAIAKAEGR